MKKIGDERRKLHYYLTILSLIIMIIYFQQTLHTLNPIALIINYLKALFIVIIILFLTAVYIRQKDKNKNTFKHLDLITKTLKDIIKPSIITALIILAINLLNHLIPFSIIGINQTDITLTIIGTITAIIIYHITK